MFSRFKVLFLISSIVGSLYGGITAKLEVENKPVICETIVENVEIEIEENVVENVEVKRVYEINETDREILIKLVYLEARGENYEGKKAVASIVLNRVESGYWGDTISDVVFAKGQFSPASKIHSLEILDNKTWNECIDAVDEVLLNGNIFPKYVLYFRADYYFSWAKQYTRIDNHYFSYLQKDYDKFVD